MSEETITLSLTGEVRIDEFVQAVRGLEKLMLALGSEYASGSNIEWIVDDLNPGSAVITLRGEAADVKSRHAIPEVVNRFEQSGDMLLRSEYSSLPTKIYSAMSAVTGILNGHVKTIRFGTKQRDFEVIAPLPRTEPRPTLAVSKYVVSGKPTLGSLRGKVQVLSKISGLRFTLYDQLNDKPIFCYLDAGSEKIMKDSWGKVALVEGMISRSPQTGMPISIRGVKNIQIFSHRGSYIMARGSSRRRKADKLSPEQAIRKIRDAW